MLYKYRIKTRRALGREWKWIESRVFDSFDKKWSAYDDMTWRRWCGDEYTSSELLCSDDNGNTWREMTDDEEFMFFGVSKSRPYGGYF